VDGLPRDLLANSCVFVGKHIYDLCMGSKRRQTNEMTPTNYCDHVQAIFYSYLLRVLRLTGPVGQSCTVVSVVLYSEFPIAKRKIAIMIRVHVQMTQLFRPLSPHPWVRLQFRLALQQIMLIASVVFTFYLNPGIRYVQVPPPPSLPPCKQVVARGNYSGMRRSQSFPLFKNS